eukprot:SAG25_NODE_12_length_28061_cov_181.931795_3_plen_301_part_00
MTTDAPFAADLARGCRRRGARGRADLHLDRYRGGDARRAGRRQPAARDRTDTGACELRTRCERARIDCHTPLHAFVQENPSSSRSHAICTFGVGGSGGVLRVIDLAGSERHESNTEHTPARIAEMKDINWSLGCLKECIRKQREATQRGPARMVAKGGAAPEGADGAEHYIPFRRSKLTMLLKDCFTSSTVRTIFLGHVAPTARSAEYTKNTLDYASQMCLVAEKKKKSINGVVPPDRWSKTKFADWLRALEGGRFSKYLPIMQINGATMQNMPLSGKEGLTKRFEGDALRFVLISRAPR